MRTKTKSIMLLVIASFLTTQSQAADILVDFEQFQGLNIKNLPMPALIPVSDRLYDQLLDSYGVIFTSGSSYVAVCDYYRCVPSGTKFIGGSAPDNTLTWSSDYPITITFFKPGDASVRACTDFVSVHADLCGNGSPITLKAFDINGNVVAESTQPDSGLILEVSTTGKTIHYVQFFGHPEPLFEGVGIDDLKFHTPEETPERPEATTKAASNISDTTATLNGYLDNDGGEPCTFYFGYLKEGDSTATYTTKRAAKRTGDSFSENISDLTPDTEYKFWAVVYNQTYWYSPYFANILSFRTKSEPVIKLKRFEINQAFQEVDRDGTSQLYKLIETKPFVVNVRLDVLGQTAVQADVELTITESATGVEVYSGSKSDTTIWYPDGCLLEFFCDYEPVTKTMTAGDYDFKLVVKDKQGKVLLDFTHKETFCESTLGAIGLYVVQIICPRGTGTWNDSYVDFPEEVYPVPRRGASVTSRFETSLRCDPYVSAYPILGTKLEAAALLLDLSVLHTEFSMPVPNGIVCGVLPVNAFPGAPGSSLAPTATIIIEAGGQALAHEIGHCRGLMDEYVVTEPRLESSTEPWVVVTPAKLGPNPPPLRSSPGGMYLLGGIRHEPVDDTGYLHPRFWEQRGKDIWQRPTITMNCGGYYVLSGGYDVDGRSVIPRELQNWFSMMSEYQKYYWISGPEYAALGACKAGPSRAQSLFTKAEFGVPLLSMTSATSVRVALSGIVNLPDNTADLRPMVLAPHADPTAQASASQYRFVFIDALGVILDTFVFEPIETEYAGDTYDIFYIVVDLPQATRLIQLRIEDAPAAELRLSAHAPSVVVMAPNGNEQIIGDFTITWSGTDPDGDKLFYTIKYSHDGGEEWSTLAINRQEANLVIDTNLLPGGDNCLVKVEATDGWNRSEDVSDAAFSISTKPPRVTILKPKDGDVRARSESMEGRCTAWDRETGYIEDPNAIVWSSDKDGVLGKGTSLGFTLSLGQHILTVLAIDPEGKTGTDQVNITVTNDRCFGVEPSELKVVAEPGKVQEVILVVGEVMGKATLHSVTLRCTNLVGREVTIKGTDVTFDLNNFDVAPGGQQVVHAFVPVPSDFREKLAGSILVQSADGGTRSIRVTIKPAKKYAPTADAGGPYTGVVGEPIRFDASGSYDPDGEIVWYGWDFDGDGKYEATGSATCEHTWQSEFSGTVTLLVTDDNGRGSMATASVVVSAP